MADIFREVDEMMKQERLERFWRENKLWIISFIVICIVGTAGISIYKSWDRNVKEEQTSLLLTAFESPSFPAGIEETAAELRPSLRGIALLSAAQSYLDKENESGALDIYKLIIGDNDIAAEFRDLAVLMQVRLDSTLSSDDKITLLSPIQNNKQSPWHHHANLESALIQAHDNQDYAAARLQLDAIIKANPPAPLTLAGKAKSLDHLYSIKQDNQSKSTVSPATVTTTD